MKHSMLNLAVLTILNLSLLLFAVAAETPIANAAPAFNDPGFASTWNRVDKPVEERSTGLGRGYTWGPSIAGTESIKNEPYGNGTRVVQYFDKARMEVNNPLASPADRYYVTTGLLVKELVTGLRQDGDSKFTPMLPSREHVAGDPIGSGNVAPTYADFRRLVSFTPGENSSPNLTGRSVGTLNLADTASEERKNVFYDTVTRHNVPDVFMEYARTQGLIWDASTGNFVKGAVYYDDDMLYVRGRPVSEAYWTRATVGGTVKSVMVQLFERRVLTYTPSNPAGFKVEMGNVGQHYHRWRYQSDPKIALQWELGNNPYRMSAQTIAVDADDNTYIAGYSESVPTHNNRRVVNKYRPDNSLAEQFALVPCLDTSSYVDIKSLVYQAAARQFYILQTRDNTSSCVQKYDADFKLLASWDNFGTSEGGRGKEITSLAVDKTGNFYLLDKTVKLIRKFNSERQPLGEWSVQPDPNAPSSVQYGIVVDSLSNVYLLDTPLSDSGSTEKLSYRFQKFDTNGKFLLKWNFGTPFSDIPPASRLQANLTIDRTDKLVVVSTLQGRFITTSTTIYQYNLMGEASANSDSAPIISAGIAAKSNGYQVLSAFGIYVYKYNSDLKVAQRWHINDAAGGLSQVQALAVSWQGETYALDTFNNRIQKYDSNGKYVNAIISGERLANLTTDRQGNLFVVETVQAQLDLSVTERIRKFNALGAEIGSWYSKDYDPNQQSIINAMATDTLGNLYVLDGSAQRVQKFDNTGKFLQQWSTLAIPQGLAIDSQNNVYVSLSNTREIVKYDAKGTLLGKWKLNSSSASDAYNAPGRNSLPFTIDGQDNLWIIGGNTGGVVIERYTLDGKLTGSWDVATQGAVSSGIVNLAATPDGGLIVATSDSRLTKFKLTS